ncbi:MAG: hypothetical protein OXH57_05055 [Ekhidna sp.]|nr:hypothetical protein [Ekhidna sp.]
MTVTRLERKGRRNKNVAKSRVLTIKKLNATPTIKNVDIEEIKAEFAKQKKKPAAKKAEAKTVEVPKEGMKAKPKTMTKTSKKEKSTAAATAKKKVKTEES